MTEDVKRNALLGATTGQPTCGRARKLVAGIAILLVAGLLAYGIKLVGDIKSVQKSWEDFSTAEAQQQADLLEIASAIGYGRFIHNFKNYIIRGDRQYLLDARSDHAQAQYHLNKYLGNVENESEKQAVGEIQKL